MVATPSDIAAGTRDTISATWADGTIAARYPSARDGSVEPAEGFFDAVADAQTVVNARATLIGVDSRGRYVVPVRQVIWPDLAAGLPCATLVDGELALNRATFAARFELDLDAEVTSFEQFG